MDSKVKYYAGSFLWGAGVKIFDAIIKFVSIPLLLKYFGKENYGLLTLAIATNAYMQLLDMGMNTGGVKFFAQWISNKDYQRVDRVARTNITFYSIIGIINTIVLIMLAIFGDRIFKISTSQFQIFKSLLYILATFSLINWINFVFNQLLIASEKMAFTQQVLFVKSFVGLLLIFATIYLKLNITQYFFYSMLISALVIIPYYIFCFKLKLIKSFLPAFFWKDFSVVFKYGLAILAMGIFQFTATQSRPLIIGMFAKNSVEMLAEYRIIEVFPIFIISIGGIFINIFLPRSSKAVQSNNHEQIKEFAYSATLYTSILVSLLCFPFMLISKELLTLYVGPEYSHLYIWLVIWLFSLTLFLHNSPVASLVLATGKTKMLVISSAIACCFSIIINISLTNIYGVGSAVIGYFFYVLIQMLFYYLYFNNRVLKLDSFKIFKSFFKPTFLAIIVLAIFTFIPLNIENSILKIFVKLSLWGLGYFFLLIITRTIDIKDLKLKFKKNKISGGN